ncbi:MAG: hypothetical protein DRJ40_11635 [Thermoprotei archaeon]|nr:MAG: hypothetical protein DRJ40_11635 [Thermoprotei archaeon]
MSSRDLIYVGDRYWMYVTMSIAEMDAIEGKYIIPLLRAKEVEDDRVYLVGEYSLIAVRALKLRNGRGYIVHVKVPFTAIYMYFVEPHDYLLAIAEAMKERRITERLARKVTEVLVKAGFLPEVYTVLLTVLM